MKNDNMDENGRKGRNRMKKAEKKTKQNKKGRTKIIRTKKDEDER